LLTCNACKRRLRVKGLWTAFIVFMVFSTFFGLPYPDSITFLILLVLVETVVVYAILFNVFVELVPRDAVEKVKT
jgi:hypothetical protein